MAKLADRTTIDEHFVRQWQKKRRAAQAPKLAADPSVSEPAPAGVPPPPSAAHRADKVGQAAEE
jgi:hypothetical protein